MSSHYSQAFKPQFTAKCYNAAKELVRQFEEVGKGYPVLCYTGFSGVTAATMLAAYLSDFGVRVEQIYIRKPGEKSHGNDDVEFSNRDLGAHAVPIFVDDFMDSGATHNNVRDALIAFHEGTFNHHFYQHRYKDWAAFYSLSSLKEIDFWESDYIPRSQKMPRALIGDQLEVDIHPDLWENDLPYLTEEAV